MPRKLATKNEPLKKFDILLLVFFLSFPSILAIKMAYSLIFSNLIGVNLKLRDILWNYFSRL